MRIVHKRHRDSQRAVPAGECALCGCELYAGSLCWRLGGWILCETCAASWMLKELVSCGARFWEVRG